MIAATALRVAGPGALLVARPAGVTHVYVGPLTPSGRYIPRAARTVCRAHTRQLRVTDDRGLGKRMCARCSARLTRLQAGGAPRTRDDYLTRYGHLTAWDLALELTTAEDTAALDEAAFLSLLVVGHFGCKEPVTTPDGDTWPSLHQLAGTNRHRLAGYPEDPVTTRLNQAAVTAREIRKAERKQIREQQDERIRRVGFVNAQR